MTVKQARKRAGLTAAEMARRLGIAPEEYLRMEPDAGEFTAEQIANICRISGVTVYDIFCAAH